MIRLREQLSRKKTVSVLFWVQLSRHWLQLIRQRDSCSHKKAVRLSKKWYDFFTATAVSHSGTPDTATATAIPCAGTAISRTYIICERVVKRSWNVLNAPAPPQPLYLLGFRQIRERWNLFFVNLFFLEKHTEGLRGSFPLSPSVCLYSYHAPSHWKCSRRGLHTDSCR